MAGWAIPGRRNERRGFSEFDLMLNYELPVKPAGVIAGVNNH